MRIITVFAFAIICVQAASPATLLACGAYGVDLESDTPSVEEETSPVFAESSRTAIQKMVASFPFGLSSGEGSRMSYSPAIAAAVAFSAGCVLLSSGRNSRTEKISNKTHNQ